jgi:hypothetical protein
MVIRVLLVQSAGQTFLYLQLAVGMVVGLLLLVAREALVAALAQVT